MPEPPITIQASYCGGTNNNVTRVVIHATCPELGYPAASAAGTSLSTARYFTSTTARGSAHYVTDGTREDHCVADSVEAYHAPPNQNSIGIELCGEATYTRDQWLSPAVAPILGRAAVRVAELCERHGVPKVRIGVAELLAGAAGVCGHVDVSTAWRQSDHTDPGPGFPWDAFMALVTGSTKPPEDDFMAIMSEEEKAELLAYLRNTGPALARLDATFAADPRNMGELYHAIGETHQWSADIRNGVGGMAPVLAKLSTASPADIAAALLPPLLAALKEAATEGSADPQAIANAAVDRIGHLLSPAA